MVRIEELQALWQNQPATAAAAFDARGLTEELRHFGRQQIWINLIKTATLVGCFFRLMTRGYGSPVALTGVALMYIGLITYLVTDWRNQIGISRLDFSAPSVEFVRLARARLQHQLNPMRRYFWFFVLTVGGGFNLFILSKPHAPLEIKLIAHLTATTLPFAAYVLGIKIREIRFRRECGAVMERLDTLVRTLEEQAS